MKVGECWCNEREPAFWLWDENHEPVIGIDGENAMLRVRISPGQGRVGLPIEYELFGISEQLPPLSIHHLQGCPFCGRKLANEEPRCPEGLG